MRKLIVPIVLALCLCIAGCGGSDSDTETGSVESIRLRFDNQTIPNNSLTKDLSDGTLIFTADVIITGKASKDFTLSSSNTAVAAVSGKTATLLSGGNTVITATAAGDSTKRHAITLIVRDDTAYSIHVTGGTSNKLTATVGDTVTLIPGTEAGKEFSDWTIDPPTVVMISHNQFRMPASAVTVTGNFAEPGTGAVPYFITNMLAQDSSTALLVQWHNALTVTEQTVQIVTAAGSFEDAREIQVTGFAWNPTRTSGADVGNYPARNIFRTEIRSLLPNTLYKYRVGENGAWSKTFTHLTASGTNADFSFTMITDPQNATFTEMVRTMNDANSFDADNRFFVNCGDIANYIGLYPQEIANYTNEVNEINIRRPVATTQGNHDTYYNTAGDTYIFGNAEVFNSFTVFPDNGFSRNVAAFHNRNRSNSYYFYYNRVLVIVLNTMGTQNPTGTGSPNHTAQAAWLENVLSADKAQGASRFRIVATHVSPFGGRSSERWLQPEVRAAYGKICTDYNVDIFFAGHDHVYGRSHPVKITGNTISSTTLAIIASENPGADGVFGPNPGGVIYSIVGSTGPKFYTVDTNDAWVNRYFPINKSEIDITPGMYVNVKVQGNTMVVTAKRTGFPGELDRYEVSAK